MPNHHRGEIFAELGGRSYTLCLTLGSLAELEAAFGAEDLIALAARFETGRLSARDAAVMNGYLCHGLDYDDTHVAGIIHATNTEETGIDLYIGSGGAPEGVLAAAALRCIGGQMQGRLILDTEDKRERARRIEDPNRTYGVNELASGDVLFAATGVTDGNLIDGVRLRRDSIVTSTVVMRSWSRTVRWIRAEHAR